MKLKATRPLAIATLTITGFGNEHTVTRHLGIVPEWTGNNDVFEIDDLHRLADATMQHLEHCTNNYTKGASE